MKRRDFFIRTAALAGGVGLAGGCSEQRDVSQGRELPAEKVEWKMVTCWPKGLLGTGQAAELFAENVKRISGGQFLIKVYSAGELVPAFEVFDAVQSGATQISHSSSYYWKGKDPSFYFFSAVPFGLTAEEMDSWLFHASGLKLWSEVCKPFDLIPIPAGSTGMQMGGWYRKPIESLDDLQGMKIRIPGLGATIMQKLGATPVNLPGGELFTSLQTGVIDAVEWSIPAADYALGLFRIAKYYYYPGWQEPGTNLECLVNGKAYRALPQNLREALWLAARASSAEMAAEYYYQNFIAVRDMVEKHGVQLRSFPDKVIQEFKRLVPEVLQEVISDNEQAENIYRSYSSYLKNMIYWESISKSKFFSIRA